MSPSTSNSWPNGTTALVMTIYRTARFLRRHGFRRLSMAIAAAGRMLTGVEIHPGARLAPTVRIWHGQGLVIAEGVVVGEDTSLFQGVTLGMKDWKTPVIGADVVVHAGAKIIGGVRVGDHATIGANAVVVRDVAAHDVVAGVPARSVKRGS